jgi:NTE family protein
MAQRTPGIGLALSGGGYRATLYNLGSLWRLNDAGLLKKLTRITSVSGGSITSGALAVAWKTLDFDAAGRARNFPGAVAAPLRAFCKQGVDVSAGLEGLVSLMDDISDRVAKRYRENLVGDATLQDLPADDEGPRFVFYATSLQTGSSVRLSRPYIADYRIGRIPDPRLPLALTVAASSAFPPVLSPVVLKFDADAWEQLDGADLFPRRALREKLILTDGGVYDNMGLENVWDRFETVLVSDAGAPLDIEEDASTVWHKQALRVLAIVGEQSRALRKRELVANLVAGEMKGAYWGITTAIADYGLDDTMCRDTPVTEALRAIRTRLNPFNDEEQGRLINWGYALCDAALRRYLPGDHGRGAWPVPEQAL